MSNNKGTNQHYVPQLYLRKFAGTGSSLYYYDKGKQYFRLGGPNSVCTMDYIHSPRIEDGMSKSESEFAKRIQEALSIDVGKRGFHKVDFTKEHELFSGLLDFLVAQISRTPNFIESVMGNIVEMMSGIGIHIEKKSGYIKEISLKYAYFQFFRETKLLLFNMDIFIVKRDSLITSDEPVILQDGSKEYPGFFLPISRDRLLVLKHPLVKNAFPTSDELRKMTARNGRKYFVSHPDDKKILESLREEFHQEPEHLPFRGFPRGITAKKETISQQVDSWREMERLGTHSQYPLFHNNLNKTLGLF